MTAEQQLRRVRCPHCEASVVVGVENDSANCISCLRPFLCPPWSPEQARVEARRGILFNHPPEVLAFVDAIEQLCKSGPRAIVQQALAAALWRITNRERLAADDPRHEIVALVLRNGGRELSLEVRQLPEASG